MGMGMGRDRPLRGQNIVPPMFFRTEVNLPYGL